MAEKGEPAPDFALPTDDGGNVSLARLEGRVAVLYFYPKDDTSGCTAEAKDFTELAREFARLDVAVIGVSPDGIAKHRKFRVKHELTIQLASDEDKVAAQAFGVWVEKSMYGRKYMGVDRATFLIDGEGRIARSWRKVKVPGHAAEVLDAARELVGAPSSKRRRK